MQRRRSCFSPRPALPPRYPCPGNNPARQCRTRGWVDWREHEGSNLDLRFWRPLGYPSLTHERPVYPHGTTRQHHSRRTHAGISIRPTSGVEPNGGFEPPTRCLQNSSSAAELIRLTKGVDESRRNDRSDGVYQRCKPPRGDFFSKSPHLAKWR